MAVVYATPAELASWLPSGASISDVDRVLARASELIDSRVRAVYDVDDTTGLPTDPDVAAVLRAATCAQVEQWVEVGEHNDVDGLAGTVSGAGGWSGQRAPALAPRAARFLLTAGLLTVVDGSGW